MTPMTLRAATFHAAPPRAPRARATGLARFARLRAKLKGGDLNLVARLAARALGRRVVGDGVLWLTVPRAGWRVLSVTTHDVGSDHPAVLATLRHRRTRFTITCLVINCRGVTFGEARARRVLQRGLALQPDVVFATECRPFRATDTLDGADFTWWQPGELGSSESGALLGARRTVLAMTARERVVGSEATSEGEGIDERSIVRARLTQVAA